MGFLDRLFGKKTDAANPYPNDFTNKITGIMQRLGMRHEVKNEYHIHLLLGFDEEDGPERSQLAIVSSTGDDGQFVTISSPVGKVASIGDKFDAEFMNELLITNNTMIGFGYALETLGETEYLVTCSDQVLATLDDSELQNAIVFCAGAADDMEKQLGLGDEY
jgi:hypothetical protein